MKQEVPSSPYSGRDGGTHRIYYIRSQSKLKGNGMFAPGPKIQLQKVSSTPNGRYQIKYVRVNPKI